MLSRNLAESLAQQHAVYTTVNAQDLILTQSTFSPKSGMGATDQIRGGLGFLNCLAFGFNIFASVTVYAL